MCALIISLCMVLVDVLLVLFSLFIYRYIDFRKRWCILENGSLSYFDSDKVVEFLFSFFVVIRLH